MKHFVNRYDIRLPIVKSALHNPYDDCLPEDASIHLIGIHSPLAWRRATEKLAFYFRREFGYDFVPYQASEKDPSIAPDRVVVFPITYSLEHYADSMYFVGAAGMRWCEWEDTPAGWVLDWAWFHPYERRQGHLSTAWPFMLKKFPQFRLEHPLSDAMEAFLKSVGYKEPEPAPTVAENVEI